MKALVTGATGFVGYHVVRFLLKRGVRVSALVRKGSDRKALDSLGVESVTGDVRDYDSVERALEGCSRLYHLAADYRFWVEMAIARAADWFTENGYVKAGRC